MRTNTILTHLSQSLALDIPELQRLFANVGVDLTDEELTHILSASPAAEAMPEYLLIKFLNELIDSLRGKREGAEPEEVSVTAKISNNDVLKKLRIALNLQEQQVREAFKLVTIELTKSDLSALFRKAGHPQYHACDDELLIDFITGLGLLRAQQAAQ